MNKKIIIGIIAMIIVIIVIITMVSKKSDNNVNKFTTNDTQTIASIEEELKEAIEKSKEMYINYGKQNFDVYFGVDFINQNFVDGEIRLVTNLENNLLDSNVKIYLENGDQIEEFPTINYEKENYKIEEGKVYLLKVYSHMNSINYYYTMQIDRNGNATLQLIYYTEGEIEEATESEIEIESES